jgi:hypothetical protein
MTTAMICPTATGILTGRATITIIPMSIPTATGMLTNQTTITIIPMSIPTAMITATRGL